MENTFFVKFLKALKAENNVKMANYFVEQIRKIICRFSDTQIRKEDVTSETRQELQKEYFTS